MTDQELYLYIKENFVPKKGEGCLVLVDLEPFQVKSFTYKNKYELDAHFRKTPQSVCARLEYFTDDLFYDYSGQELIQEENLLNKQVYYRCEFYKEIVPVTAEQVIADLKKLKEYLSDPQSPDSCKNKIQ